MLLHKSFVQAYIQPSPQKVRLSHQFKRSDKNKSNQHGVSVGQEATTDRLKTQPSQRPQRPKASQRKTKILEMQLVSLSVQNKSDLKLSCV